MAKLTKDTRDGTAGGGVGDACSQAGRIAADLRPLVTSFCPRCQGTGATCVVDQLVEAVDDDLADARQRESAGPGDVRVSGFGPGRA